MPPERPVEPARSGSRVGLILVAAGQGARLGAGQPKALVQLGAGAYARPLVEHALRAALGWAGLTDVVVVAPPAEGMEQLTAAICSPAREANSRGVTLRVVAGGAQRSDSVRAGLAALPPDVEIVLVHDAARALAPAAVFERVAAAVQGGHQAVTPALPVVDTIKQVQQIAGEETVVTTLDRSVLRAVQTPQGFHRDLLERAHAEIADAVTDDCGMVEALGGTVHVVPGSALAMKITTADDLALAAALLERC